MRKSDEVPSAAEAQIGSKAIPNTNSGTSPNDAEVDVRIYMAAERTFLAWVRTGIALMGFGFVVARFGLFLREFSRDASPATDRGMSTSMLVGVVLILLGVAVHIGSAIRYRRYIVAIDRNEFRQVFGSTFAIWMCAILCLIGLVMSFYLFRL